MTSPLQAAELVMHYMLEEGGRDEMTTGQATRLLLKEFLVTVVACPQCHGTGQVTRTEAGATEQEFLEGLREIPWPCPAEHVELRRTIQQDSSAATTSSDLVASFCKYADPTKCEWICDLGYFQWGPTQGDERYCNPDGEHWDDETLVFDHSACGWQFKASAVTEALETP